MYMYCKGCEGINRYYTAHVVGAYTDGKGGAEHDVSNGHSYTFKTGTKHKMINYTKEWGYGYAGINACPSTGEYFDAYGAWSPDSI